jgi:hypothetical protein
MRVAQNQIDFYNGLQGTEISVATAYYGVEVFFCATLPPIAAEVCLAKVIVDMLKEGDAIRGRYERLRAPWYEQLDRMGVACQQWEPAYNAALKAYEKFLQDRRDRDTLPPQEDIFHDRPPSVPAPQEPPHERPQDNPSFPFPTPYPGSILRDGPPGSGTIQPRPWPVPDPTPGGGNIYPITP